MFKHYIFGNGGFAREVQFILFRNGIQKENIIFIDEQQEDKFLQTTNKGQCYIAVGSPVVREKIYNKLRHKQYEFPNLFDKDSVFHNNLNTIGFGNIFCAGSVVTVDCKIGNFNNFNLLTTVGHDAEIHNFCTFSPGVKISGNSKIKNNCFFGTNSCTIEGTFVNNDITIGAGAVVVKDLKEKGTYVGVPCKKIN